MSERGNFETAYALSPLQEGLLFHALLAPGEGVYLDQLTWIFQAPTGVSAPALRSAWEKVVERHAVLRTAFSSKGRREPLQVVLRRVVVPFEELDWTALSVEERRRELERFLAADRSRGFDFARPPLLRFVLIREGRDCWRCVLTYHHVLMDAWSLWMVLAEVLRLYKLPPAGGHEELPPPRPYADYIGWLRRQDPSRAEDFWRRELAGFAAPTALWVDTVPTRAARRPGYSSQTRRLSASASAEVTAFARRHQLTVSTLVQAAWGLLLSRYSSEPDVLFGLTVSGRPDELIGADTMVGLFINTIALRLRCSPETDLLAWLRQLGQRAAERRQFEHSPLVAVQGWSGVPRHLPLFRTLVVFENAALMSSLGDGSSASFEIRDLTYEPKSNYELTLMVAPGDELSLRLLYQGMAFDGSTIGRALSHLVALLGAMVEREGANLAQLVMLSAAERAQLLVEWQDTAVAAQLAGGMHDSFFAQATLSPDRVALLWGEESWSYGELARQVSGLAVRLRILLPPAALVGICLERSADMVKAVLAVAAAGCAYVPIDVGWPLSRRSWILSSHSIPGVITSRTELASVEELVAELPALREVLLVDEVEVMAGELPAVSANDLAYIIFTSGSTGRPKGVMVRHQPVLNLIAWANRCFGLGPSDRVLFVSALSFDLSVFDIFGVLAAGGSIRVASSAEIREPRQLLRRLISEPITFWDSAPAALQQVAAFFDELPADRAAALLRLVFLSGDWIPLTLPGRLRRAFPHAQVVALGGATEATVWSNSFLVDELEPEWVSVPYGRPMANARYLVLDARLEPCPVGVAGDLYIGGLCLATGYARAPELTAKKFLPSPAGGQPGERLYFTGDRARFWPDGLIEFLGRRDQQVKIRGFRIELGEIEAELARHPDLAEVVAEVRTDAAGERRLVAYVVPRSGREPSQVELRAFLANVLPEHMMPSRFVTLECLPVTENGKLDRRALPEVAVAVEEAAGALRTQAEELLAALWAEVLAVPTVGNDDNFFELGGHSLRATQIVARIRETFAVELDLATFFSAPTVRELARCLGTAKANGAALPAIERLAERRDSPLSFTQHRIWHLNQLAGGEHSMVIPFAVQAQGSLDVAALCAALGSVVLRHEALRTTFALVGDEPMQSVAPRLAPLFGVVDLEALAPTARQTSSKRLLGRQLALRFDLGQGPLLRVAVLRLRSAEHLLALTLHHIVADGWSMGILFSEVGRFYAARLLGRPLSLPELPFQFADYASWQRRLLESAAAEAQLVYWRQQLQGVEPAPDLPCRVAASGGVAAAQAPFQLSAELSLSLRQVSREQSVTLFMTLLAAFVALLHHATGGLDLVVGTNVANRQQGEFEGVIGAFVNTLALRLRLEGDPSFAEMLRRAREAVLGASANQDVPFERVLAKLRAERAIGNEPLFRAMLVVEDQVGAERTELPGLRLSPVAFDRSAAAFDFMLYVATERDQLSGVLDYNTSLYDGADMDRLLAQLTDLLARATADPGLRLSDLSLTSAAALADFSDDLEEVV